MTASDDVGRGRLSVLKNLRPFITMALSPCVDLARTLDRDVLALIVIVPSFFIEMLALPIVSEIESEAVTSVLAEVSESSADTDSATSSDSDALVLRDALGAPAADRDAFILGDRLRAAAID
jgi:hypothetical protein